MQKIISGILEKKIVIYIYIYIYIIYIYTYTFFILNIYGICLRIAYDLEKMHRTIQDIYLKPYSFLTCM